MLSPATRPRITSVSSPPSPSSSIVSISPKATTVGDAAPVGPVSNVPSDAPEPGTTIKVSAMPATPVNSIVSSPPDEPPRSVNEGPPVPDNSIVSSPSAASTTNADATLVTTRLGPVPKATVASPGDSDTATFSDESVPERTTE